MPKVLRIINRFNLGGPTFNAALLTKYMSPKYETMLIGGKEDKSEESSKFILENLGISGILIEDMHRDLGLKNDRKAFLKINQYDATQPFKPWLRRILINAAIDYYRKYNKRKQENRKKRTETTNEAQKSLPDQSH